MAGSGDARFARSLLETLPEWEAEGLLSPEQATALRERYHVDETTRARLSTGARLAWVLGSLGAILIGAGVVMVFARNWWEIPMALRLGLILLLIVGAYALGDQLALRRKTSPVIGAALLFLATLFFGAGVFLVGQMYHVQVEWAHGLLVWGFAVLPLAYVLKSAPILAEAVLALSLWVFFVSVQAAEGLGDGQNAVFGIVLLLGLALYGLGQAHQARWPEKRLYLPLLVMGAPLIMFSLYFLTFNLRDDEYATAAGSWPLPLLPVVLGFIALGTLLLDLFRNSDSVPTAPYTIGLDALLIALGALGFSLAFGFAPHSSLGAQGLYNLLFLAASLLFIAAGTECRQLGLVNFGLGAFGLLVITRYFDWFWGLAPGALAFIVGGLVLLGLAFGLERARRRLLHRMHLKHKAAPLTGSEPQ
jgi:uncharacterized membrane protein